MKKYLVKIKELLYRKLLSDQYLKWRMEAQKRGYEQGYADAEEQYKAELEFHKERYSLIQREWVVDPEDVLTVNDKGIILLNGEQISDLEAKELKAEAKAIKNFRLFKILQETLRQKGIEKSVLHSTDLSSTKGNEAVLGGKMMIHAIGVQKSIVDVLEKYIPR